MLDEEGAHNRFLLGINYWPRTTAMAMWSRFDAGEIDEDFARIAELGFSIVRFFLTWEAFQPDATTVDEAAFAHLDAVLDSAEHHRLRTMPALFCGHMSGVNWLPGWTLDDRRPSGRFRTISAGRVVPYGIGDFYRMPLLEAQRRFAMTIAERARGRTGILAWDLGNEFSNLRQPETQADAAAWSAALAEDLANTSSFPVTAGTHGEDLTLDRRLRLSSMCAPLALATMHGYPAYSSFARGPEDPEVVPFLAALARRFARKPVLFSEFGNPACVGAAAPGGVGCLEEDAMAVYATGVLERLHARGALGAFWWCWTDYANDLASRPPFDRAPHELHFGIVRADGSEKPVASALRSFARERRTVLPVVDAAAVEEEAYYAALPRSTERAYGAYLAAHDEPRAPCA